MGTSLGQINIIACYVGWYMTCQSSECHHKQKKVLRESMSTSTNLCKHLTSFRENHRIKMTPSMIELMGTSLEEGVADDEDESDDDEEMDDVDDDIELRGLDKARVYFDLMLDPSTWEGGRIDSLLLVDYLVCASVTRCPQKLMIGFLVIFASN